MKKRIDKIYNKSNFDSVQMITKNNNYINYSKFKSIPKKKFIAIIIAVSITGFFSIIYVNTKARLFSSGMVVNEKKATYDKLKFDNDAKELSIKSKIDLDNILNIATNKLGMVKIKPEQIVEYDRAKIDSARQYENIPK